MNQCIEVCYLASSEKRNGKKACASEQRKKMTCMFMIKYVNDMYVNDFNRPHKINHAQNMTATIQLMLTLIITSAKIFRSPKMM